MQDERPVIISCDGHATGRPEDYVPYIEPAYRAQYEDMGFIWLNYNTAVNPVRRGLDGPIAPSTGSGLLWNVHEWRWTTS